MNFTFNPFATVFQQPNAKDILKKQLRDAESSKAEHATNREYHEAMETMLDRRIARIRAELGAQ